MMPTLPGTHLVFVHARLTFASLETGFNADTRFDHARQLRQRRFLQLHVGHACWSEVIPVAIPGILIASIPRCLGLQRPVIREGTTGDHQPLRWSRASALQARLHASLDHLYFNRTFLSVSYRQPRPPMRIKGFPPDRHRLPRWLRRPAAPVIGRPWGLQ